MSQFGEHDSLLGLRDYSVYGDNWGYPQVKVSIGKLELLRPHVIKMLQGILSDFPGWEVIVAVAVEEHLEDWPDMGLCVREHEIIDGLQRQYFPPDYRDIEYEGSRPGEV